MDIKDSPSERLDGKVSRYVRRNLIEIDQMTFDLIISVMSQLLQIKGVFLKMTKASEIFLKYAAPVMEQLPASISITDKGCFERVL